MSPSFLIRQKGSAVLITMLSLLMLASLVILSTLKSVKAQTKVVQNQKYVDQAFQASEAGLEVGFAYLKENYQTVLNDTYENDGAGNGYIDLVVSSTLNDVDNDEETTYDIEFTNPTQNDFSVIQITSKGSSDSGNVGVNISQQVARTLFSSVTPPASLTTLGSVTLSGNVTLENTDNDVNILSGGVVVLSGSASTQASGSISSDKKLLGADVLSNQLDYTTLSKDEFFYKLFGASKSNVEARADYDFVFDSDSALDSLLSDPKYQGKSIWINQTSGTAKLSGNTTIGSAEKPVFIVINGDFKANGTTEIYGVLYITQDWLNKGGGNLTIHGAVIVEGSISATGAPNIIYESDTIRKSMNIATFSKIPGSWHDF